MEWLSGALETIGNIILIALAAVTGLGILVFFFCLIFGDKGVEVLEKIGEVFGTNKYPK